MKWTRNDEMMSKSLYPPKLILLPAVDPGTAQCHFDREEAAGDDGCQHSRRQPQLTKVVEGAVPEVHHQARDRLQWGHEAHACSGRVGGDPRWRRGGGEVAEMSEVADGGGGLAVAGVTGHGFVFVEQGNNSSERRRVGEGGG